MPGILVKRPIDWLLTNGHQADVAIKYDTAYRGPVVLFVTDTSIVGDTFRALAAKYPNFPARKPTAQDRFKFGFFAWANLDRCIAPEDVSAEHRAQPDYQEGRRIAQLSHIEPIEPIPFYYPQMGRGKRGLLKTPTLMELQNPKFIAEAKRIAEATIRLNTARWEARVCYDEIARTFQLNAEQAARWERSFGQECDRPYLERLAAMLGVYPDWLWGLPEAESGAFAH